MAEDHADADTEEVAEATKEKTDKIGRKNYVGLRLARNSMSWYTTSPDVDYYLWQYPKIIGFGTTLGHRFTENIRLELEVDYTGGTNNMKKIHEKDSLSAASVIGNFYWDRNLGDIDKAWYYFMFGVGASSLSFDIDLTGAPKTFKGYNTAFTFQFGAGLMFALSEQFNLDVGIRYRNFGNVMNENIGGVDFDTGISSFQYFLGGMYRF
jgi:opacity protein-like surface antigen